MSTTAIALLLLADPAATEIVGVKNVDTLTDVLMSVVLALLPAVVAILGFAAKKFADLINANVKSKTLADTLVRFDYSVLNAVKYVEQTAYKAILAARSPDSPGGEQITKEEADEIKAKAIAAAKSFLGEHGLEELRKVMGGGELDTIIGQRIEAAVHDLRTSDAAIKANTGDLPRLVPNHLNSIPPGGR